MFKKTTLAFALLLATAGLARAAPPAVITYGGFLLDGSGAPVTAASSLTFRFYAALSGGTPIASETISVLPNSDGYFSAVVGSGVSSFETLFESQAYMSVQVVGDSQEMTPRIQITSVPSALSVAWSGVTGFPESSCSGATPVVTGVDLYGRVTCGAAAGAVTSVTAGSGLSGGTITSTGTISIATGGVTSAMIADGAVSFADLASTGCSVGQVMKFGTTGWGCAADIDTNSGGTVTSITATNGLSGGTITGTGTIGIASGGVTSAMIADGTVAFADWSQNGCSAGQVPQWNGAWTCATVSAGGGSVTSVGTGSGLTGGPITTTGTISIATGGITFSHLGQNGCATGQIPKWGASGWACSNDLDTNSGGTVTSVTATASGGVTMGGTAVAPTVGLLNTCTSGQVLKAGATLGTWACGTDNDTNSGGTVTSVTATASGGVTMGGTAVAPTVGLLNTCTSGQVLKAGAALGTWACGTDNDTNSGGTVTSVDASPGIPITVANKTTAPVISMTAASSAANGYLTSGDFGTFSSKLSAVATDASLTGNGTSASLLGLAPNSVAFTHWQSNGCAAGQIPKLDGTATKWACANDLDTNSGGTITGVTAGSGLSGGGTSGSVTLSASYAGSGGDFGTAANLARSDHGHNSAYYTKSELNVAGTINSATNPVDWTKLKGVPAGFADGVDNDSGGDITSVTAGSGLTGGGTAGAVTLALDSAASPTFANLTVSGALTAGWEVITGTSVPVNVGMNSNNFDGSLTGFYANAWAMCSTGKRVIGGGCYAAGGGFSTVNIATSRPDPANNWTGWHCVANSGINTNSVTAYAICARIQ